MPLDEQLVTLLRDHPVALVVVDLQNDFCHPDGLFGQAGKDLTLPRRAVDGAIELVDVCREAGAAVIWIQQGTEPDGASDSDAWLRYKTRDGKDPEYTLTGSWGHAIVDELQPRTDEVRMLKYRSDSFHRTPLDTLLTAKGIRTVVLCGVNTEGCVDATLRSTLFHDYFCILVEDAIGSPNPDNHEAALSIMRTRHDLSTVAWLRDAFAR
jgi:ureidoacrylate peracid hydrolase